LQRLSWLKVKELYPAHGGLSEDPEGDILRGLEHASSLFDDTKVLFDALAQRWGQGGVLKRAAKRTARGKGS